MADKYNPPPLSPERLAEIREAAIRQVEAELGEHQQPRHKKPQWVTLPEAWRRLHKLNPDPAWIDHVLAEAAASGDVGIRDHAKGGRPIPLTAALEGKRLQIVGNCIAMPDPGGFPDVFFTRYSAVEMRWTELRAYARDLLP